MKIEEKIFLKYRFDKAKLIKFGFNESDGKYSYSFDFMDGQFSGYLTIDSDHKIYGKVIEKEFGEEYIPLNIETFKGDFVNQVRKEYENELIKIRDACFSKVIFVSNQANRIARLVYEKYGEEPDFPFEDDDNCGVFRYTPTRKWYAIVMNVKKSAVTKNGEKEKVDAMNVKIVPETRDKLLERDGMYICYHMSHEKWITMLLDETLCDDEIMNMIETSRELIIGKKTKKNVN